MSLPAVAILGAPNVGKSTLFNRLLGRRRAIVTDEPGMTRDRLCGTVLDVPRPFRLIDTGGLTPKTDAPFAREIELQAEAALREAAVVCFVVDARAGATALDHELASGLRRCEKSLLLVANKVDSDEARTEIHTLHALGLGEPLPISAEHGRGIPELLDALEPLLEARLAEQAAEPAGAGELAVAIVGRPNVGKSSIFNRLVGEERVMVSEIPGTTRDAIDTLLELEHRRFRLIDTAGLRRPGKVRQAAERFSVSRAHKNIERCDVAVLVLDAAEPFAARDAHIAGTILDACKPLLVAVNKWDLVEDREPAVKQWEDRIRRRMRFAKQAPIIFVSALTGQRILKILDHVELLHRVSGIRVATTELNRWLREERTGNPTAPPPAGNFGLFYATQTGIHPPTFVMFCNDPERLHFSLRRQLENSLRDRFGFGPAPIRLQFRGRR